MEAITNTVMTWVKDNCMKDKADMELTPTTSFFATNILDSMDFLNLVEFVQEQYDVDNNGSSNTLPIFCRGLSEP